MAKRLGYTLVSNGDNQNITVFNIQTGDIKVATSDHPYWDDIVAGAIEDDPEVFDLFDLTAPINRKLESLTSRISIANGVVYYDGDPVHNSLAEQIVRFVEAKVEDWRPLAAFFEKVMTNLNEHTREQLFDWLQHNSFKFTSNGNFLAYKGVERTEDGQYLSIHAGTAFVNGEEITGQIPNAIGSVISMPRSKVQHDPSVGCHTGLHAGTESYATSFARGAVLLVEIDPADVVSVPTDCAAQKLRVSKYIVRDVFHKEQPQALVSNYDEDNDFEDGYNSDPYEDDDDYWY